MYVFFDQIDNREIKAFGLCFDSICVSKLGDKRRRGGPTCVLRGVEVGKEGYYVEMSKEE